jgi:DNA-binding NarL/FixJ family response regulator
MGSDPELRASGSAEPAVYSGDEEHDQGRSDSQVSNLTDMEERVLTLATLAKTNKEIAAALGISSATVKRHMENLLRKLKLRNRVELAVYGLMVKGYAAPGRSSYAFEIWRERRKPE